MAETKELTEGQKILQSIDQIIYDLYQSHTGTTIETLHSLADNLQVNRMKLHKLILNKMKPTKHCPKCQSTNVIMFTADLDMCNDCNHTF